MLAADKLLLQSNVKQRATQLREKELNLFNDNFNAVGTQSAVLAGFAMTSFAEIDLPHNAFYAQKACLHLFVTISICANLLCTASTTFVSVWGSGKALRGKDGSMDSAVDGMYAERAFIFACFGVGLITTLLALMAAATVAASGSGDDGGANPDAFVVAGYLPEWRYEGTDWDADGEAGGRATVLMVALVCATVQRQGEGKFSRERSRP